MRDHGDYFLEKGDASFALPPIDVYEITLGRETKGKAVLEQAGVMEDFKDFVREAAGMLPFAREQYRISANIKDYLVMPVVIMPSDLPNRNHVGFPYQELTAFNVEHGNIAYKTWKYKPTYVEHDNLDPLKARGMIFDTAMRILPGYQGDLHRVINLCAFDRTKDPALTKRLLAKKGKGNSFSMGSLVNDYECSICSSMHSNGGCDHVRRGQGPRYNILTSRNGDKHLAYLRARGIIGFETSEVGVPAFVSASTPVLNDLREHS